MTSARIRQHPGAMACGAAWMIAVSTLAAAEPAAWRELKADRIEALAAMLPAEPRGFGPRIGDRTAWGRIATNPALAGVAGQAQRVKGQPLPAWDDDAYLDFTRTGTRRNGERMIRSRRGRLPVLVLAECIDNKGAYVEAIRSNLLEYVREPAWTLPAHDRSLGSFKGTDCEVDLAAAAVAHELAQALWLLGDRVDAGVRGQVLAALERRVFAPVRASLRGAGKHWWLRGENNWNPVCLAGTVGAALAVLPERADRAVFAAAGEHYVRNYLRGYTADGYCSEGMGYWNYGMLNYLTLREQLLQATGGRLDLFSDPLVRQVALFGVRMEIVDGIYPAIADCRPGTEPSAQILRYCSRALGLGLADREAAWAAGSARDLVTAPMELAPFPGGAAAGAREPIGLRSWFESAGVLVCRPSTGATVRLGAVIKGGHNAEHHNHNDVGSFSLALGGRMVLGDPGGPLVYTARTFSGDRYTKLKLFGSHAHPVPKIDGVAQAEGRKSAARVLRAEFGEAKDVLALDIAAAYPVPGLRRLTRTFTFVRGAAPYVEVTDEFEADRPIRFETALTTRVPWRRDGARVTFGSGGSRVVGEVTATGSGFDLREETIEEDCPPFERLGLYLREPQAAGRVTIRFSAAAAGG